MGDDRENSPASGIVRHDSHMQKSKICGRFPVILSHSHRKLLLTGNNFTVVITGLGTAMSLIGYRALPNFSYRLCHWLARKSPGADWWTESSHVYGQCVPPFWRCVQLQFAKQVATSPLYCYLLCGIILTWGSVPEPMRVTRGDYGAAPEYRCRGNGRTSRKPTDQWNRPARLPHWLHYSPPTKANRISECGNRSERCRWPVGFLGDLPFSAPLHSGVAPYALRFTLIGSQALNVKSRPNLFKPSEFIAEGNPIYGRTKVVAPQGRLERAEHFLADPCTLARTCEDRGPGSIPYKVTPGFLHVGIVPDDAACWGGFRRGYPNSRPRNPLLLRIDLVSSSSALKISLLRDALPKDAQPIISNDIENSLSVILAVGFSSYVSHDAATCCRRPHPAVINETLLSYVCRVCMTSTCIVHVPNTPWHACNNCADVISRTKVLFHLGSSYEIWKCICRLWMIVNCCFQLLPARLKVLVH
ncbi:hypothetical protein PR048_032092 [Dryococelus australis]|uniref:Uncharacterized protein n=1 Tax=Dryococelus australis TaxID=614101 RepID=A0ABQ9G5D0_9NEOP|nr:hypothetical protein PR048_032092 [Dryococelus australis]